MCKRVENMYVTTFSFVKFQFDQQNFPRNIDFSNDNIINIYKKKENVNQ